MIEDMLYFPSNGCTSEDGKHLTDRADPPYYLKCEICGMRFYLIPEDVLKDANIKVVQRPIKEV